MKKIITTVVIAVLGLTCLAAEAQWQCNVRNARNQLWKGTGPTPAIAKMNAFAFCQSNSLVPSTCRLMQCFPR